MSLKLKRREWIELTVTLALMAMWGALAFLGLTHRINESAFDMSVALGFASATVFALLVTDLVELVVDARYEQERSDVSE